MHLSCDISEFIVKLLLSALKSKEFVKHSFNWFLTWLAQLVYYCFCFFCPASQIDNLLSEFLHILNHYGHIKRHFFINFGKFGFAVVHTFVFLHERGQVRCYLISYVFTLCNCICVVNDHFSILVIGFLKLGVFLFELFIFKCQLCYEFL